MNPLDIPSPSFPPSPLFVVIIIKQFLIDRGTHAVHVYWGYRNGVCFPLLVDGLSFR